MYNDEDALAPVTIGRVLHAFAPWVALAALIVAVLTAFSNFRTAEKPAFVAEPSGASQPTTSTAKEVKGLEAVARTDLKLRALADDESDIVANVEKGSVLDILLKDAGHFKARDEDGHIGWIPNDSEFISVRDKKKNK